MMGPNTSAILGLPNIRPMYIEGHQLYWVDQAHYKAQPMIMVPEI